MPPGSENSWAADQYDWLSKATYSENDNGIHPVGDCSDSSKTSKTFFWGCTYGSRNYKEK